MNTEWVTPVKQYQILQIFNLSVSKIDFPRRNNNENTHLDTSANGRFCKRSPNVGVTTKLINTFVTIILLKKKKILIIILSTKQNNTHGQYAFKLMFFIIYFFYHYLGTSIGVSKQMKQNQYKTHFCYLA